MTYDEKHIANTIAYAKKLETAFLKVADQCAAMVNDPSAKFGKSFAFKDRYALAKPAKVIFDNLKGTIESIILSGNATEWELANNKNDALVNSYTKNLNLLKSKPDWTEHNQSALQAFNKREIDGISLSDRVWKLTKQAQMELEVHVGYGLLNGDSAATISRRIRQYLDDPTALFRRVRNEMGELEWSKAAKAYQPGQGKYRSAYKNARRLAVTETNMAYHTADHERWGSLPMVKGFRVSLSGSHPMDDICDVLKGEYPKEFKFSGWHPQCLCHAVPILMDAAEYDKYEEAILDGTDEEFLRGVKGVENMPEGFTKWIGENAERSKGWKGQPYFIKDNFKGGKISGGLSLGKDGSKLQSNKEESANKEPKVKPVKTIAQILDIQNRWKDRLVKRSYSPNMPEELKLGSDYLKGTNIAFENDFFDLIDKNKPIGLSINNTSNKSFYNPNTNIVNIGNSTRNNASKWQRERIIYHEFGHGIDRQRDLRGSTSIKDLMGLHKNILSKQNDKGIWMRSYDWTKDKYFWERSKQKISRLGYIDNQLVQLDKRLLNVNKKVFERMGITYNDISNQIGATRDTIMAIDRRYGYGHEPSYFKMDGMKEAEFIAHCFENKFVGNRVFKKYLPDLYNDMVSYIQNLK